MSVDAPSRPEVDFDHFRPASEIHPWEALRDIRGSHPVAWSPNHGGFWVVAGYDAVADAFRDQKHLISGRRLLSDQSKTSFNIPSVEMPVIIPSELDPPEHLVYRRLLNAVLSPGAVAGMRPRVEHWTSYFLDQAIESGAIDLTYDYTSPVPAAITLEWLGLPTGDAARVSHAYHDMLGYPPEHPRAVHAHDELHWVYEWVLDHVEQRRQHPRDDVISWVLAQHVDGAPMELSQAYSMIMNIVGGGVDTSTNATAWALWHLNDRLDHREILQSRPEAWDLAIEELLRRYPPVLYLARTVAADIDLGGCPLRAGDRVMVSGASANHDEKQFANPFDVVLDRHPNRHLTFGLGPHRCPGMHLAKLEMRVMMEQLLERAPDYRIDGEAASLYPNQGTVSGWTTLPATFTPGPRVGD